MTDDVTDSGRTSPSTTSPRGPARPAGRRGRRRTTAPAGSSSSFTVQRRPSRRRAADPAPVRVPPGVTVFDSASWNGIAIDSTCGGHGTCHKCRVRVDGGRRPVTRHDVRTFSREQLDDGLAAGLPGPGDPRPRRRRTPADHPAQGRHGRRRPAGDPAAGRAEAVRRARRADAGRPAHRPRPAARRDRRPRADRRPARAAPAADGAARGRLQGDRGGRRRGRSSTSSPATPPPSRYAIAFDLGTTTVVATLLDVGTGTPLAVASMLNRQQPFGGDVITRISATMMDPRRARAAPGRGRRDARRAGRARSAREGGVDPAARLRGGGRRQRHDDRAGAGHRPRAARRGAVRHVDRRSRPSVLAARPRAGAAPAGPGLPVPGPRARTSAATSSPGMLATGHGPRQADPALHRRRHQLRDRAQRRRHASSPPPRPPGRPSRAARSAAACAPPTARSRWSS